MFKLSLTAVLIIAFSSLRAQAPASLAGTGWKGTMPVPDPILCILKFDKDTLHMVYADAPTIMGPDGSGGRHTISGKDSASLEDMVYRFHADTLFVTKVWGGSPCSTSDLGLYKVKVANGKMTMVVLKDACDVRPYAMQVELTKVW